MIVGVVTGSRKWPLRYAEHIRRRVLTVDALIVGDASGADEIARATAFSSHVLLLSDDPLDSCYVADWGRYGRRAGPLRNARMVRDAAARRTFGDEVRCWAFPMPGSVGTWDCVFELKRAGLPVQIVSAT